MARAAGAVEPSAPHQNEGDKAAAPPAPLIITSQPEGAVATAGAAGAAYRRAARSLQSAAIVYAAGGMVYALVLATPWTILAGGFVATRFLLLFLIYMWPTVLAVNLVAALGRRQVLVTTGVYALLVMAVAGIALVRNPALRIDEPLLLWFLANGPATILLLAFLRRRVRAVGPLVLAFMLLGTTGAFLAIDLVASSDAVLRGITAVAAPLGLDALTVFVLLHLVGFAMLGAIGWWLLGWIGRQYRAKRLSDQSITMDALWLLFAVAQTFTLAFEGWPWIFTGLVAFAAYKLVTRIGFALLRRRVAPGGRPPMLLLLRVFALGRRSEQFFDAFSLWWLRAGSISLIAGPDLVTTTVAPHEFLEFVGGRLSRRFVQGAADLEQRLACLDQHPDPDGRYRVNEFFCHADTWQMTMRRLARESDAVLMDLRSFSQTNQGCLYELEQLLNLVDLERVTFLVDETTERTFFERTLQVLWQTVDADSPNRQRDSATVTLVHAGKRANRAVEPLLRRLFASRGEGETVHAPGLPAW
jgi:hypothetical protein